MPETGSHLQWGYVEGGLRLGGVGVEQRIQHRELPVTGVIHLQGGDGKPGGGGRESTGGDAMHAVCNM
jgi:hypothetical protein